MQTVNFRCGHCNNLMAVAATHLGQQVRCPHCQQVVTAPSSAAAPAPVVPPPLPVPPPAPPSPAPPSPAPPPTFQLSESVRDHDSIFAPPDEADDDLFGGSPKPRLEIPTEATWPQAPTHPPAEVQPTLPATSFEPAPPTETVAWNAPPVVEDAAPPESPTLPFTDDAAPSPTEGGSDVLSGVAKPVREIKHTAGGNPWILPLVILPLISYSVLVTILLAMAYTRPAPPHPLEMQRDDDGSNPGARRVGKERVRRSYNWRGRQLMDLPEKQRVALGDSIVVGDVRVRPLEAEVRKIMIYTEGYPNPDPSPHPTLVLHLEIENVSNDVAYFPLDAYFDRRFEEKFLDNVPFTFLEKGEKKFFGGAAAFPAKYKEREVRAEALELQGVDGDPNKKLSQNVKKELMPGEKWRTFVACNADNPEVAEALQNYDGPLLYRIRLRRGLVPFKDQEVSATTVIGVEFTGKDVKHSG